MIQPKQFVNKQGESITIRTALPEDAKWIIEYTKSIFNEAPYLITTLDEFHITHEQQEQFLKTILDDEGKLALLAEYQGNIIGFLDFHNGS